MVDFRTTAVFDWNYTAVHRIIVNQGGSSSGKTYAILQVLILKLLQTKNMVCTVVGQDIPNLKKGAMRDMERIFQASPELAATVVSFNRTERVYRFINGSIMEFTSYKDEQDAKSGKRDFAFINEANGISYEIFNQVAMRTTRQIFIDYNPTSAFWAHTKLLGRTDTVFFYSRYTHNDFVDPGVVAHIESYRETDPESWKVYGLGKTGQIHGLVFDRVTIVPELPDYFSRRAYGLDFGYVKPCAGTLSQETEGELYLHELFYRYGMKNRDIADALFDAGIGTADPVYCDSAEPRTIAELQDMGISAIGVSKGPDSIKAGIRFMKGFSKINITAESTNWRKEQQNYRWKQKDGEYLDEPIKAHDHCFKGDTLITTTKGLKPIKDVVVGDEVINTFGKNKVLQSFLSHHNLQTFLYKITCSTGQEFLLNCTSNHLVKTAAGWIEVGKLLQNDLIWASIHYHTLPQLATIQSIEILTAETNDVYDLTIETNHEFIAGGIVVHNCWDSARYGILGEWGVLGRLPEIVG